jgi:hypothetical protein
MSIRILAVICMWFTPFLANAQPRIDAYGFPLPEGAIARLGDLRFAQPETITALALSLDDKVIATGLTQRVRVVNKGRIEYELQHHVLLWDAQTGRITEKIPMPDDIESLVFSKNGFLLAVGMAKGSLTIWDIKARKEPWPREHRAGAVVSSRGPTLRFLNNDRALAVAWHRHVQVWDVAKGTLTKDWQPNQLKREKMPAGFRVVSVALSPSGKRMAWLAAPEREQEKRCEATVYDILTGDVIRTTTIGQFAQNVCMIDEGDTLLLQGYRRDLDFERGANEDQLSNVVFDTNKGRAAYRFLTRQADPYKLRRFGAMPILGVSPIGKLFYASDEVGTRCFDVGTGKMLGETSEECWNLAITSDSKRILVAAGPRIHWYNPHLQPLRPDDLSVAMVRYRADGRLMAKEWSDRRLNIWDPDLGKVIERVRLSPRPPSPRNWIRDDEVFHNIFVHHDKGDLAVHDLANNREICRLEGLKVQNPATVFPSVCPDGTRVLVAIPNDKGILACWYDAKTGRELGRQPIDGADLFPRRSWRSIEWLATDGSNFGYVTSSSRLTVIDCKSAKAVMTVGASQAAVRFPAWQYRSAGYDRFLLAYREPKGGPTVVEFVVIDRKSGGQLRRALLRPRGVADTYNGIRLSPDGRSFWAPNNQDDIRMYESATGRLRGRLAMSVDFGTFDLAPDGKTLAVSCLDSTILIFDINRPLSDKVALPAPSSAEEGEKLWQTLADPDPAMMEPALWALVRAPKIALPLLKQRLKPARASNLEPIRAAIAQLDSSDYKRREAATRELAKLAESAIPALYAALKKDPPVEQKRRVEELLVKLESQVVIPSCLRELRALEVLERIGSVEARKIAETIATGSGDELLTLEAGLVLSRWRPRN